MRVALLVAFFILATQHSLAFNVAEANGLYKVPARDLLLGIETDGFVSVAVVNQFKLISGPESCQVFGEVIVKKPFQSNGEDLFKVPTPGAMNLLKRGACTYQRTRILIQLLMPDDLAPVAGRMWVGLIEVVEKGENVIEEQVVQYKVVKYGWHPAMAECSQCKIFVGPDGEAAVKITGDAKSIKAYQRYMERMKAKLAEEASATQN